MVVVSNLWFWRSERGIRHYFFHHDDLWFSVFKFREIEARLGGVNF